MLSCVARRLPPGTLRLVAPRPVAPAVVLTDGGCRRLSAANDSSSGSGRGSRPRGRPRVATNTRDSAEVPIVSVNKLDTLPAGVVKPALDAMAADDFDPDAYHKSMDRFMREWRSLDGMATVDADGTVHEGDGSGDLPTMWSYGALSQDKVAGSAPPPNPYNTKVEYPPPHRLLTSKANPAQHTDNDAKLGRLYPFPSTSGVFPEGLAGGLEEHFAVTGDRRMVIPSAGVELVQRMRALQAGNAANLPPCVVLDGPRGVGKSATLNYLVHYARANDWVCLFVPDVYRILHAGRVTTASRRTPGMVDQHDVAMEMLAQLLAAHGDQLATVSQRGTYTKDRYLTPDLDAIAVQAKEDRHAAETERRRRLRAEAEASGRPWDAAAVAADSNVEETSTDIDRSSLTLKDMVAWGIAHPPSATDTLLDVKAELAAMTEFPVLLAVDGVQAAYHPVTSYPWEGSLLTADDLTIPSELQVLHRDGSFNTRHTLARGVVVATMSYQHEAKPLMLKEFPRQRLPTPLRVPVPAMDRYQVFGMLSHLQSTHRFNMLRDEVTPETVEYFRILTGGRPSQLCDAAMLIA